LAAFVSLEARMFGEKIFSLYGWASGVRAPCRMISVS
jgi:hypothetical protein